MQRFELDDLDRTIIGILGEDGRLSASEIAAKIGGVSERTVRNRVSALLQSKMIVISAMPDPAAMGMEVQADVLVDVEPGRVEEVAVALGEYEQVFYMAAMAGSYSMMLSVYADSNANFLDFCETVIGRTPGVRRVQHFIVLRMYKAFGTRTTALAEAMGRKSE